MGIWRTNTDWHGYLERNDLFEIIWHQLTKACWRNCHSGHASCYGHHSTQLHSGVSIATGSFHVKSPNGLNPTLSEFNEIWHTCWFQPPNLKSKIFQWSDDQFPRYGRLIFWKFWERGSAQLQNTISFELVVQSGKVRYLWKGEKARNSNLM